MTSQSSFEPLLPRDIGAALPNLPSPCMTSATHQVTTANRMMQESVVSLFSFLHIQSTVTHQFSLKK